MEYLFVVKSTIIESIIYSDKTALSEANVKTNRTGLQNEPITKNTVFPVATLFF